jgi:hypothetical protein
MDQPVLSLPANRFYQVPEAFFKQGDLGCLLKDGTRIKAEKPDMNGFLSALIRFFRLNPRAILRFDRQNKIISASSQTHWQ